MGPFALPEARVLHLQGFALARHTLLYLKRDITNSLELTCGCLCDPDVPSPEGKHLSVGQRVRDLQMLAHSGISGNSKNGLEGSPYLTLQMRKTVDVADKP